jgi:hypothetical protein
VANYVTALYGVKDSGLSAANVAKLRARGLRRLIALGLFCIVDDTSCA